MRYPLGMSSSAWSALKTLRRAHPKSRSMSMQWVDACERMQGRADLGPDQNPVCTREMLYELVEHLDATIAERGRSEDMHLLDLFFAREMEHRGMKSRLARTRRKQISLWPA